MNLKPSCHKYTNIREPNTPFPFLWYSNTSTSSQSLMTGLQTTKTLNKIIQLRMCMADCLTAEQSIGRDVVFVCKILRWIVHPQIELLSQVLSSPYCRPHVPHSLVVQRYKNGCPRIWIYLPNLINFSS